MKRGLRRVAAVAVATLVVAPALATVASATSTFAFDRLAGANRYATSVKVATTFGTATSVILANGTNEHTVDALTAAYLAGVKHAPILLTQLDSTPTDVVAAITATGATTVYIVGGTGAISAAQETALDAKFGTVTRLGGDDRYLTAEKIMAAAGVAKSTTALLATGNNFPDALGAGPLSYVKGMPVALTGATLPAATLRALKAAGTTKVIALGGTSIVTAGVLAELATNGITLDQRIAGADRAETSSKLADYMITSQGFLNTAVNVASGDDAVNGADALGGAALSGKELRPTLITDSATTVGTGIMAFLTAHAATLATGHIFGGLGAIAQSTQDAMETAAQAATHDNPGPLDHLVLAPASATITAGGSQTYTAQGFDASNNSLGDVTSATTFGQLGLGDTTNRSAPVQVGTDTNWASIAAGQYHTVAVKTDGTLWAWGNNGNGQLGLGDTTNRSAPVQVGTATWVSVAAGFSHTVAVKTDGTLWAWGRNDYGPLGDGDTTEQHAPVQVGTATWVSVAAGAYHTVAVKTGGTLWAWGLNGNGQLGLGDTTNRSAPVQVGTGWASVAAGGSHTVAVKTDGTLWAWGLNSSGQLGDGTIIERLVPVQEVGHGTDWVSVAAGGSHTVAVKTDGTLYAWGLNSSGQLGLGNTTNRSAPVQVGTGWASVAAGYSHTVAVKTTGELYAWGLNGYGQLGDGTTSGKSAPVRVGSATNWVSVAAGLSHTIGLRG